MSVPNKDTQMPGIEAQLRERLASLLPIRFQLIDDSLLHAGHAGAKEGGHYRLLIVSDAFSGKSVVMRHRLVFSLIGDLKQSAIHALSIKALAPDEVSSET